ncbi:hypothetical protein EDEG_00659 [Edhazardia aedis USNM 41457]|uniref:Uncharacterized protein n=1 Tax=Edhazardia aedis (strain USNM 41457) TaxID=1003232 RepID=J9A051_EDHAE|nr:hypothetical protein EDEG_00659 [Edhazardia aedis USNM 41457]|eukprot:EJW05283.1 hypothetical protein EDEG_00659 [Edhazardia aedis USNM 41457]
MKILILFLLLYSYRSKIENDIIHCHENEGTSIFYIKVYADSIVLDDLQDYVTTSDDRPLNYEQVAVYFFGSIFDKLNQYLMPYGVQIQGDFSNILVSDLFLYDEESNCSSESPALLRGNMALSMFSRTGRTDFGHKIVIFSCKNRYLESDNVIIDTGKCGSILSMTYTIPDMIKDDLISKIIGTIIKDSSFKINGINQSDFNKKLCQVSETCVLTKETEIGKYVNGTHFIKNLPDNKKNIQNQSASKIIADVLDNFDSDIDLYLNDEDNEEDAYSTSKNLYPSVYPLNSPSKKHAFEKNNLKNFFNPTSSIPGTIKNIDLGSLKNIISNVSNLWPFPSVPIKQPSISQMASNFSTKLSVNGKPSEKTKSLDKNLYQKAPSSEKIVKTPTNPKITEKLPQAVKKNDPLVTNANNLKPNTTINNNKNQLISESESQNKNVKQSNIPMSGRYFITPIKTVIQTNQPNINNLIVSKMEKAPKIPVTKKSPKSNIQNLQSAVKKNQISDTINIPNKKIPPEPFELKKMADLPQKNILPESEKIKKLDNVPINTEKAKQNIFSEQKKIPKKENQVIDEKLPNNSPDTLLTDPIIIPTSVVTPENPNIEEIYIPIDIPDLSYDGASYSVPTLNDISSKPSKSKYFFVPLNNVITGKPQSRKNRNAIEKDNAPDLSHKKQGDVVYIPENIVKDSIVPASLNNRNMPNLESKSSPMEISPIANEHTLAIPVFNIKDQINKPVIKIPEIQDLKKIISLEKKPDISAKINKAGSSNILKPLKSKPSKKSKSAEKPVLPSNFSKTDSTNKIKSKEAENHASKSRKKNKKSEKTNLDSVNLDKKLKKQCRKKLYIQISQQINLIKTYKQIKKILLLMK